MGRPAAGTPSARERIVDVAAGLFYEKGIHGVGVAELVEKSGVAKMTLYHHFASKDAIVDAVLERRLAERTADLDRRLRAGDPRRKLGAIFRLLDELADHPGFRGCAFVNAAVDGADATDRAHRIAARAKRDLAARFEAIAREARARDPARLAWQCLLLWDGAAVEAWLQASKAPIRAARTAAIALFEAQTR